MKFCISPAPDVVDVITQSVIAKVSLELVHRFCFVANSNFIDETRSSRAHGRATALIEKCIKQMCIRAQLKREAIPVCREHQCLSLGE